MLGWLETDAKPLDTSLGQQVMNVETFTNDDDKPIYYIVNLNPSGFVIVPADDLVEPIIGFADDGSYEASLDNPLGALVINDLNGRIAAVRDVQELKATAGIGTVSESQSKWEHLEALADGPGAMGLPSVSDVRVAPLVQSKWGQGYVCGNLCYNYYTPNNYVCGCVATAMAQLMRYHEHPSTRIGVNEFTITVDKAPKTAYTRGGDGSGGTYSWSDMVLVPDCGTTEAQRQAIGALCYDAGVSVNMMYRESVSGAYMTDIKKALTTIFKYHNAVNGCSNYYNIGPGLDGMINPNLDGKYPVLLDIRGIPGGHAVVCDGYGYNSSTAYHHLNMGWAGSDDAWYNLPDVDSSYTFTSVNKCIYNIRQNDSGDNEMISGRVLDTNGNPIANATVRADSRGRIITENQTDSKGIYAFDCLDSNTTYTLYASAEGHHFISQTVTTGTSSDYSPVSGNVWGVDFYSKLWLLVDDDAPKDPGPGDPTVSDPLENGSAEHPFDTIQEAVDEANNGYQIEVAPGTYKGSFNFNGKAVRLYSRNGAPVTTIDGKGAYHVVKCVSGEYANTVLEGFTITRGNANGPTNSDKRGAGMYNYYSSPTVTNCIFVANECTTWGGGMYNDNSSPTVTNCAFIDNSSEAGGAIFCYKASSPSITNCIFTGNYATVNGGAVHTHENSNPTLTNCTFTGNKADLHGGGIYNSNSSSPTVTNCLLWDDTVEEVYNYLSSSTVTYSNVQGGWPGLTNINGDPLFVDAAGGDLRLVLGSPCIDAGNSDAAGIPTTDKDGGSRIAGQSVDIGAYEYGRVLCVGAMERYNTIQDAINIASDGDTVLVTDGIYRGAGNKNLDFKGKAINVRSAARPKNCIIDCESDGRGFYLRRGEGPDSTIENFTIINAGPVNTSHGGGICCERTSPTIRNCIIKGSSIPGCGGGIYCQDSNSLIENCTIVDCYAGDSGAGISCENASNPTLVNCLIASCGCVNDGGGIFCYDRSSPTIINCTLVGNSGPGRGGGIYSDNACHPLLTNCIIWANEPQQIFAAGSLDITFSDVQGGWPDANNTNINGNPLFVDAAGGDFQLLPGSPCIDAGSNNAPNLPATDLDGNQRVADSDADGSAIVDMGTYEFNRIHNITQFLLYDTIQAAIDDANDADQIEVMPGIYYENIDFKGKAVRLFSFGGPDVTTIDGQGAYHVVQCISGEGPGTILDGFTITGGNAIGDGSGYPYNHTYNGGGMHNYNSSPTVTNCIFLDNRTMGGGGGMYNANYSSPTVTNCVFIDNSSEAGGAIFCYTASSPCITNCIFTGNYATINGGAVHTCENSSLTLTNCTFGGNTADFHGGGIYNSSSRSPTVTNCILWGDTPEEIYNYTLSSSTVIYSNVQGGWTGLGNIDADPCFVDVAGSEFRLLPGSPCIDAGSNNAPNLPATDLGGYPRVADSDADGSAIVDMGTYEFNRIRNTTQCLLYYTIQAAIDDANDADQIEVMPGIYYENIDFKGRAVRLFSFGGPDVTTIDGKGAYHVVQCISGEGPGTILAGFTITGGNAIGDGSGYPYNHTYNGGGMYNYNSNPTVTNCIFVDNRAMGWGGGMYCQGSDPVVADCTFNDNLSQAGGAMFFYGGLSASITNCIFTGNYATINGGAVHTRENSSLKLTNCTFSGNKATDGGGMYNTSSNPMMINCTFTGNTADFHGGGIYNNNFSNPTVTNCILWDDTPEEIYNYTLSASVVTYSNVQGILLPGPGNKNTDPLFVNTEANDLRLLPGSPCIDAGTNNAPNLPSMGFEDHPRIIDGDCDNTGVVDMGAYELNNADIGDFDYNCSVDFFDFSIFARAWMTEQEDAQWDPLCNISIPADNYIDWWDAAILCDNWLVEVP